MSAQHAWLAGGGIAGLATAVLLVRDAGMPGDHIHVLEHADVVGGSLDGSGCAADGYQIRGGRMFEPNFVCTFDLLDSIPAEPGSTESVGTQLREFNRTVMPRSNCRLVRDGRRVEAPALELGTSDRLRLGVLFVTPEARLADRTIDSYFAPTFFATGFWLMWSSMFAFQSWHSLLELRRYMRRFIHLMPGLNRLEGVLRTPLNQYDSIVVPIRNWLTGHGVDFRYGHTLLDVRFDADARHITALDVGARGGAIEQVAIATDDRVFLTLGSMTDGSITGSHDQAGFPPAPAEPPAWALWQRVAKRSERFGRPQRFCGEPDRSGWVSFTVTLQDHAFADWLQEFSGNTHGTGGIITLVDSPWLLSLFIPRQPHFAGQPEHVTVLWGYGLYPERNGTVVQRPMHTCSGNDILRELCSHLRLEDHFDALFATARCIPCLMPFIGAQFMPRAPGDRPAVIPERSRNFAFLGQFTEIANDCVFTVEYSVRSAQTAVYGLMDTGRQPLPVLRSDRQPRVVARAVAALLG